MPSFRTIRLALAAVAVAGVVVPATGAAAEPPPCQMRWEPFATTSPGFPVQATVYRPAEWHCG